MLDLLKNLQNEQYVSEQMFKVHCRSIANNVPVPYEKDGVYKTVSTFEELSMDFPQLSDDFKKHAFAKAKEVVHVQP